MGLNRDGPGYLLFATNVANGKILLDIAVIDALLLFHKNVANALV